MTFGVNESKILDFIRSAVPSVGEVVFVQPLLHRVEPVDPLAWAFRLVFCSDDEGLTAERTESFLTGCQSKAGLVHWRRCARHAALTPVAMERGIVG